MIFIFMNDGALLSCGQYARRVRLSRQRRDTPHLKWMDLLRVFSHRSPNMTKSELTTRLAGAYGIPMRQARLVVDAFFDNIVQSALMDDNVVLRGFGTFSVKSTNARQSRNPQTGDSIWVDSRKSLIFKAGSDLKDKINH